MIDTLIPIVDGGDNIISYKPRSQILPGDIYRVSALWVMNKKKDVLMAQRAMTKRNDPGKWSGAVAGTVEQGETYEQNVIKEAAEEIGLTGVFFDQGPKYRSTIGHQFFCQIFIAYVDQPLSFFKRQEEEVEQIAWVPYLDLAKDAKTNPDKYVRSFPLYFATVDAFLKEGKK